MAEKHHGDLLRGAPEIAAYLFKDKTRAREVYAMKKILPLFKLGGVWCGRARSLDAALAKRERATTASRDDRAAMSQCRP